MAADGWQCVQLHGNGARILLVLWLFLSCETLMAVQSPEVPRDLVEAIDDAMLERTSDLQKRLEVVKRIDDHFSQMAGGAESEFQSGDAPEWLIANETWLKARFVEAVVNMRQKRLELSDQQVAVLRKRINPQKFPDLWFSLRSLEAALLFFRGKAAESLIAHETLLSGKLDGIPSLLVDRARINCAAVLNEVGRTDDAAELYELIMWGALERDDDATSLHAGNNLLTILLEHGAFSAARRTVNELKPAVKRNSQKMSAESIVLHEAELLRLEGQLQTSITVLRQFLSRSEPLAPLLMGMAHRLLADGLREAGELDAAQGEAERAVEVVNGMPIESKKARIALAQIRMAHRDYAGVLEELQRIDLSQEAVAARKKLVLQLRLQARLRMEDRVEEAAQLQAMLEAVESKDSHLDRMISDNYEAKVEMIRSSLLAKQVEAKQMLEQVQNREERNRFYLGASIFSSMFLCGGLLAVGYARRRATQQRLADKRLQNEKLEAMLKIKTAELTANLQTRADLAQALERKKRIETMGLLAGNVAHDINNLLQVISNANEVLANRAASEGEKAQALGVSKQSLKHGSGIIRQLLAYSRQEELKARSISFHHYLDDSRVLLESAIGARNRLVIHDRSGGVYVHVDPAQLTTSLINLLGNAVDAMPNGGTITIAAEEYWLREGDLAHWTELPSGPYLRVSVRDEGSGMDAEQIARAFEPFYSTKSFGAGTGLGLSSVHSFVKQSGGAIRILSAVHSGTEVQFLLPIAKAPSDDGVKKLPEWNVSKGQKRMLLVEDNEAVAETMRLLLRQLKIETRRVASGDEAYDVLQADGNFDLVLSDIHMPGEMDGPTLAKWIKEHYPKIRVYLMSGYNEVQPDQIEFPLLQKPFSMSQLRRLLLEGMESSATGSTRG